MTRCLLLSLALTASAAADEPPGTIADKRDRRGDEITVCGQRYHTTTRVVLWTDPGGYDAYRAIGQPTPNAKPAARPTRYRERTKGLTAAEIEKTRDGGWDFPLLTRVVDQFVIHFELRGTSRGCFRVLEGRGLSVHFMLDLDGTVYQTLDLKESAQHATIANQRSIGIEVANIGAYPEAGPDPLDKWYHPGSDGRIQLIDPEPPGTAGPFAGGIVLRPTRGELIVGTIQQKRLKQYDFTPEQYQALVRLTASLCRLFPKIQCDYPRGRDGQLIPHKLPDAEYASYRGILGHYHVQLNKVDPGPAFQWDLLIDQARKLLK